VTLLLAAGRRLGTSSTACAIDFKLEGEWLNGFRRGADNLTMSGPPPESRFFELTNQMLSMSPASFTGIFSVHESLLCVPQSNDRHQALLANHSHGRSPAASHLPPDFSLPSGGFRVIFVMFFLPVRLYYAFGKHDPGCSRHFVCQCHCRPEYPDSFLQGQYPAV
jgi:hypothetical protein